MKNIISDESPFSSNKVGQCFLNYYQNLGYKILPGSSLLDPSVPMTFVMSAGLVQVETSAMLDGGRTGSQYTLLQNCFRYFDIERVGQSNIHLSLFQMPGAFNFGSLDRQGSIDRIWELLTKVYCLPSKSLWTTYFSGGNVSGYFFKPDFETYEAWKNAGVKPDKIIGLNQEHNFWKQGANIAGREHAPKCGPHTEVFYDRGEHLKCGFKCVPGCNCGRFIEIMNTLFITFHSEKGEVKLLDEPFTETVIGLERMAMLLQDVSSVFDTDAISPLAEHVRYFAEKSVLHKKDQLKHERIIADHIRALFFLVADGAPQPGKGGRSRLMRKLIREMLTSQKILGINNSEFIKSITDTAFRTYATGGHKWVSARNKISEYISAERQKFERTLKTGNRRLDQILIQNNKMITGKEMVDMEKKYGIPNLLLEKTLIQKQIAFSRQDYRQAYNHWRQAL